MSGKVYFLCHFEIIDFFSENLTQITQADVLKLSLVHIDIRYNKNNDFLASNVKSNPGYF